MWLGLHSNEQLPSKKQGAAAKMIKLEAEANKPDPLSDDGNRKDGNVGNGGSTGAGSGTGIESDKAMAV